VVPRLRRPGSGETPPRGRHPDDRPDGAVVRDHGRGRLRLRRLRGLLGHEGEWPTLGFIALSVALAGLGIGVGWWVYGRRSVVVNTRVWKQRFGVFYGALKLKLYFDLTYSLVFIRAYFRGSEAAAVFDGRVVDGIVNGASRMWVSGTGAAWRFDGTVIDGAVNALGRIARNTGSALRGLQTGRLQSYQRLVIGAVVLLMLGLYIVLVRKGA
jgi:NADH-quinone oxidoreductase subunit L